MTPAPETDPDFEVPPDDPVTDDTTDFAAGFETPEGFEPA
jgi:hypothetical protein